jgi:transcription initiation factor IIE alpha subunit
MRGSGIYSADYTGTFTCSECEKDYELDGQTNDWGTTAYAECPDCGSELELEIDSEYDQQAEQADNAWKERNL